MIAPRKKKKVAIVGAGFSGLTAAYFLNRTGFDVEIYEKTSEVGGLIHSKESQWGLCETAANGILNSKLLEEIAQKIDIKIVPAIKESKRRFIFRKKLRTWPLNILETVTLASRFAVSSKKPKAHETVEEWGKRTLGKTATTFLLSPALQGIYAGDPSVLSASLLLSRFFHKKKKSKPAIKGLVSFPRGMGEFCHRLKDYLIGQGVNFHFGIDYKISIDEFCVVATSAPSAALVVKEQAPRLSQFLDKIEMLSVVSATCFFIEEPHLPKGFGVLFPRAEKIRPLGVLFNNCIFPYRSNLRSETYIMGGAEDKDIVTLSDAEIIKIIVKERSLFLKSKTNPVGFRIQRWPEALPHYNVKLEEILEQIKKEQKKLEEFGIFLHGNYLNGIGLSQILEQSAKVVERIIPYE